MRLPVRPLCLLPLVLAVLLAGLAPAARALVKSPPEKAILPNGLRVIAVEDRSLPILAASLLVNVGWASSDPEHPSLALLMESLLEHADTAQGSRFDLIARLEQSGSRISFGTGFGGTTVAIEAGRERLTEVLQAIRAIGFELQPTQATLDTARRHALRRLREEKAFPLAGGYLEKMAMRQLFPGTPLAAAVRPDEADPGRIGLPQVKRFLAERFVPNNAVLVVVGDVDPGKVFKTAMAVFGPLTAQTLPAQTCPRQPPPPTRRQESREFLDIKTTQVLVAFAAPGLEDPDLAAATLWEMALGGANDAWLERDFAAKFPAIRRLQAQYRPLAGQGVFTIGFESSDPEVDRLLGALLTHLSTLYLTPPRGEVLDRLVMVKETRENTFTERRLNLASRLGQAELVRAYTLAQGLLPAIRRVTPRDLERVAVRIFNESPVAIQVAHPLTCQVRAEATPRLLTLPNGVKVLVKPYAGSEVAAASLFVRTGPPAADQTGTANLLAWMLEETNSPKGGRPSFSRKLDRIGGEVTVEAGPNGLFVGGFAEKNQVRRLLEVATDLLVKTPLPRSEFARARDALAREVQDSLDLAPVQVYLAFMRRALPAAAIPNLFPAPEGVGKLTLTDLETFRQTWVVPGNLSCALVGNFDPDEVASLATEILGALPAAPMPPRPTLPPEFAQPLAAAETIEVPVRDPAGSAWLAFGYRLPPLIDLWRQPETRAGFVADLVVFHLLSWSRNGLIQRELIGKGLAEEVQTLNLQILGDTGWVFCCLRVPREKLGEARAALQKLLEGLPDISVAPEDIRSAQETVKLHFARTMERSGDQARFLVSFLGAGLSERFFEELNDLYKDVTVAQVKAAAQKTFRFPILVVGTPQ